MSQQSYTDGDYNDARPAFYLGQHDSSRTETLTDSQYGHVLNSGFSFVTTPITNGHFYERIVDLLKRSLSILKEDQTPGLRPDPIVPPLTTDDTTLFPGTYTSGLVAYSSPWLDLCSPNNVIASICRQVLNLEVSYANFCGVRSIIIPGPRQDSVKTGNSQGIAQYARAIREAFLLGTRVNLIIHIPMYREPGLEETAPLLSVAEESKNQEDEGQEIDLFSSWDSWHTIRSVCDYDSRLLVALRMPRMLPEVELQTRWFSEPLQYLTFGPRVFHTNKAGHPSLSRYHQDLIAKYMRLKHAPYFLLYDVGPEIEAGPGPGEVSAKEFPTLAEAATQSTKENKPKYQGQNAYVAYLRHIERQQEPFSYLEHTTLTNFQDWLQSPLQPLSDNLESITYEVFEGDPVKYWQYEQAITEALRDWSAQKKPTSSPDGVVIAVAGSGRGPLVTRALRASEKTGVPVRVWAVEKNPNAYVYLLRQNQKEWGGRVAVVKTDMRAWKGPLVADPGADGRGGPTTTPASPPVHGKVDILVSELLGSFGDNELSPECLDGIQHVLAPGHGISIPQSYTAHVTPIATPRIYADIAQRAGCGGGGSGDPGGGGGGGGSSSCGGNIAFDTPWVVQLFAIDLVAQRGVPGRPRFQQAWEFAHPLPPAVLAAAEARRTGGDGGVGVGVGGGGGGGAIAGGGGGSMAGAVGANDHNARHCHLTFVCRARGVVHGLAGYFESVLYAPETGLEPEPELEEGEEEEEEGEAEESEPEPEPEPESGSEPGAIESDSGGGGRRRKGERRRRRGRRRRREKVELSTLPDMIDRKSKDMISWFPIFFPLKQPLYIPPDSELEVSMWRQTDDTKVWYEWMVEAFMWVGPSQRVKVGASDMCSSRRVACLM